MRKVGTYSNVKSQSSVISKGTLKLQRYSGPCGGVDRDGTSTGACKQISGSKVNVVIPAPVLPFGSECAVCVDFQVLRSTSDGCKRCKR